jgi:putative FmdB family regulatory protein
MPEYDYKCTACRKKFSVTLSFQDHERRKVKCPKCGGRRVEQQIVAFLAKTSKKS